MTETTHLFANQALRFIDVCAHSGHPVGFVCFLHITELFSMHCRRCQPYFFIKLFVLLLAFEHIAASSAMGLTFYPATYMLRLLYLPFRAATSFKIKSFFV